MTVNNMPCIHGYMCVMCVCTPFLSTVVNVNVFKTHAGNQDNKRIWELIKLLVLVPVKLSFSGVHDAENESSELEATDI